MFLVGLCFGGRSGFTTEGSDVREARRDLVGSKCQKLVFTRNV